MCCGSESHHDAAHWGHHRHHYGGHCACGGHSHFGPRFWTEKEKIAWLKQYLQGLREEVKTVEEHIAALKGEE